MTEEFLQAIDAGDLAAVRDQLVADPSLRQLPDEQGLSPLMHALYRGQKEIAKLIGEGLAEMSIYEAAAAGNLDRLNQALATDPGLAKSFSGDGFTALQLAAFFGHADLVARLLDAGADVAAHSRNEMEVTALNSAAATGQGEVAARLLAAGAPVDAAQRHGWTPLHAAAMNKDLAMARMLLDAGANPAAKNDDGKSAADLAREAGSPEVLELLAAVTR